MTDPQPLSPQEEAALRQALSESNGPNDDVGYAVFADAEDAETVAARLFATLDAARATSAAPDLRAALAAIDDLPGLDSPGGYVGEMVGREAAKDAIRAALAAPDLRDTRLPQPSRDALDVERLARAIRTAELQTQMDAERLGAVPAEPGPLPDWYRAYAADVAAEYTRLTADARDG